MVVLETAAPALHPGAVAPTPATTSAAEAEAAAVPPPGLRGSGGQRAAAAAKRGEGGGVGGGRRSPPPAGTTRALEADPVLAERDRRIAQLTGVVRRCEAALQKAEREEKRRRKRRERVRMLDADGERSLVERVFYAEVRRRDERRARSAARLAEEEQHPVRLLLSAADVEGTVARVYSEAVARKEAALLRARAAYLGPEKGARPGHTLGTHDVADLCTRLCDNELAARSAARAQLMLRYAAPAAGAKSRPASPEQVQATSQRLYGGSLKRKAEVAAKLRARYMPEPVGLKLTRERQAAMANRLCTVTA